MYVSCSPHDEGWIQEHLVRCLTGPPHYLTVCLNQYDIPKKPLYARQHNAKQIERSTLFIVACSRHYQVDPTGRLQFEREVARKCGITMLCVKIRGCEKSVVEDLFDVEEVFLSSEDGEYPHKSLDMVLERLQDQKSN